MKVTNWFLNFDFGGRARRSHYWANVFAWSGVVLVLLGLIAVLGGGLQQGAPSGAADVIIGLLLITAWIAAFIDGLAMVFRRAHDTNKSGWIALLLLIPFVNLLPLYWLLIQDSDQGANKYGPPVKKFYQPDPTPAVV